MGVIYRQAHVIPVVLYCPAVFFGFALHHVYFLNSRLSSVYAFSLFSLSGYAREHQPCIIFMDEIDAIGGRRFSDGNSSDREIQRTLMEVCSVLHCLYSHSDS